MNDELDPMDHAYGDRLRAVLEEQARLLDPVGGPDDGLRKIRARIQEEPMSNRRWAVPMAAAAAAVLVLVGGVLLWPRGGGQDKVAPGGVTPTPTVVTSHTTTGSASPSPSGTSSQGRGPAASVPVYYGGTFNGQTMLYREFHRVTMEPVLGALQQMLKGPADADYRSLWPAGTRVVSLTRTGDTATVTLSAAPLHVVSSSHVDVALQEVVYTVTATDPSLHKVTLRYPGTEVVAATRAVTYTVLAQVWLLTPAPGASVSSPVTLSGVAEVFEAQVNWEVDRPDGTVVTSGSALAQQAAPGRWPWSTVVTLPKGSYVAKAFTISPKDGSVTWVDSKPFTVR